MMLDLDHLEQVAKNATVIHTSQRAGEVAAKFHTTFNTTTVLELITHIRRISHPNTHMLGYVDKTIDNIKDLPDNLHWDNAEVLELLHDIRTEAQQDGALAAEESP